MQDTTTYSTINQCMENITKFNLTIYHTNHTNDNYTTLYTIFTTKSLTSFFNCRALMLLCKLSFLSSMCWNCVFWESALFSILVDDKHLGNPSNDSCSRLLLDMFESATNSILFLMHVKELLAIHIFIPRHV
jgi:hypothetical protein